MALVSSYEGFIFDYGGVLVLHQTDVEQARLAAIAGVPQKIFDELYWSDRLDYDKGLLSAAEYWQALATRAGGGKLTQAMIDELIEVDSQSWMHFDSVMWDWIDQLRAAGKRVAMLSNMPRELGETLKSKTDRLSRFDQVTLSYELHAVKPEPAIYEQCLEGIGTAPGQTLFLDDKMVNVQGAEVLGIRAIQFLDRDDVLLRLRG
ncbi:MAG TPA: HAD family phosphatase [Bryobacteraceae bacterium]|nr:HAD family phosphatase [Bryobacteraceae bacterium]